MASLTALEAFREVLDAALVANAASEQLKRQVQNLREEVLELRRAKEETQHLLGLARVEISTLKLRLLKAEAADTGPVSAN